MAKKKKSRREIDWRLPAFMAAGVIVGLVIAFLIIQIIDFYGDKWYTGWECFAWNTTRGIIVTGRGQYVNAGNQTIFATWEQLGYVRTECVKYTYIKQRWPINNSII